MNKIALCIGINDYPGTGSDLAGCVNDANDWSKGLKARGFDTKVLVDKQATGQGIRAVIKDAVASATSVGDQVIVQYSGHGSYVDDLEGDEPDGTDECLCPYDIGTKGELTDDELAELYGARRYGVRLVMLSDSCHSGTVARFARISTPPTVKGKKAPQRRVRFLPPATFLSARRVAHLGQRRATRASSPPGRGTGLLMSACQDVEYSYDAWFNGRANGAFSFVALKALKSLKKNATYRAWHTAIREVLPSQQYPQQPNLFGTRTMKAWPAL